MGENSTRKNLLLLSGVSTWPWVGMLNTSIPSRNGEFVWLCCRAYRCMNYARQQIGSILRCEATVQGVAHFVGLCTAHALFSNTVVRTSRRIVSTKLFTSCQMLVRSPSIHLLHG